MSAKNRKKSFEAGILEAVQKAQSMTECEELMCRLHANVMGDTAQYTPAEIADCDMVYLRFHDGQQRVAETEAMSLTREQTTHRDGLWNAVMALTPYSDPEEYQIVRTRLETWNATYQKDTRMRELMEVLDAQETGRIPETERR